MGVMRRSEIISAGSRIPIWARRVAWVLAAGLLLGTVDLHSLVHHRQNLAAAALAAEHPGPIHLDTARSSHELACLACAPGLKSQGRLPEATHTIVAPADEGLLAAETWTVHADRLSYRLPLSRAPPLS